MKPFSFNFNFSPSPGRSLQDKPTETRKTMEPFHFHRQEHHPQHDNQYSTPAPNATVKVRGARKYILPERPVVTTAEAIAPDSETTDIADLSNSMRRAAISPISASKPYQKMSPASLESVLNNWAQDKRFMADGRDRERFNPFPNLDLNEGWTRARCEVKMHFAENAGATEQKIKIQEAFKGYSLWSQLEPLELDGEDLKSIFGMVFVGNEGVKEGWARVPGAWWAQRKHLFAGDKGVRYEEKVAASSAELWESGELWKTEKERSADEQPSSRDLKRERPIDKQDSVKKAKTQFGKPKKVMSEEWRARRRWQEKKAGRWTDGTLAMDRMWTGFHWVLDDDDWQNQTWPKSSPIKEVNGNDIWG